MGDNNIAVEKDGVIVGWRIVVLIAAASLGLYVSNIIAPLTDDIERTIAAQKAILSDLDRVGDDVDRTMREDARAHQLVEELRNEVNRINTILIKNEEEHRGIWRSINSSNIGPRQ